MMKHIAVVPMHIQLSLYSCSEKVPSNMQFCPVQVMLAKYYCQSVLIIAVASILGSLSCSFFVW